MRENSVIIRRQMENSAGLALLLILVLALVASELRSSSKTAAEQPGRGVLDATALPR